MLIKLKKAYSEDDFKGVINKTTSGLDQKKGPDKNGSKGILVKERKD